MPPKVIIRDGQRLVRLDVALYEIFVQPFWLGLRRAAEELVSDMLVYYEGSDSCETTLKMRNARRRLLRRRWKKEDLSRNLSLSRI